MSKPLAKDKIQNLTANDMRDYMYGTIQSMIEGSSPENVVFQYFMPPIPFGPELAAFMDIGPKAKAWEEDFHMSDLMRSAVNFATIVDYVPELGKIKENGEIININSLISSGITISSLYESVLNNCRVVDTKRSDEDEEKLRKLRALLYVEPSSEEGATETNSDTLNDEDLLAGFDDGEDFDLDSLFDDGASTSDFTLDPNAIAPQTKTMKLYDALALKYDTTVVAALDAMKKISPNDPNAGVRVRILKNRIKAAAQRWEAQGSKTKVEAILARIEQLSQGGMVQYLQELRDSFEGNKIDASVFADEENGVGMLTESAYYTALRPNGILSAKSHLSLSLSNSNTENWSKMESTKSGGSFSIGDLHKIIPILSRAGGSASELDQSRETEFFKEEFEISFEIVQGVVDRPWLSKHFLESRAYTTVDPRNNKALDPVTQITQLSDGNIPPQEGMMKGIPMTVYFVRNLKVKSKALANLSKKEIDKISGGGGFSLFGFGGASGRHTDNTVETSYSSADTTGEITANGTYLVAMTSVYMKKSPNPDFDSFPKDQWI